MQITPRKAANYGRPDNPFTYDMGRMLNLEIIVAWHNYKQDKDWLKQHPERLSAAILHSDSRNHLKSLLRIRRAGRVGI